MNFHVARFQFHHKKEVLYLFLEIYPNHVELGRRDELRRRSMQFQSEKIMMKIWTGINCTKNLDCQNISYKIHGVLMILPIVVVIKKHGVLKSAFVSAVVQILLLTVGVIFWTPYCKLSADRSKNVNKADICIM